MKKHLYSYWLGFYVLFSILSLVDYIEHISRPGQDFELDKGGWFLFTLSSTLALFVTIAFINYALAKVFKNRNIVFESLAILAGFFMHIFLSGPLCNNLFFPQALLHFYFNPGSVAIVLGAFYVLRLMVFVANKIKTNNG